MTSNEGVGTGGRGASGRGIEADVVVVGAGLAGLVAAVGGQAHWSFGGLFMVNTPEQRRLGVRDSEDLALADWHASAGFDRPQDALAKEWAAAWTPAWWQDLVNLRISSVVTPFLMRVSVSSLPLS